jgi:hypothetical protein
VLPEKPLRIGLGLDSDWRNPATIYQVGEAAPYCEERL